MLAFFLNSFLSGYFTIEQLKTVDKTLMQDAPLLLKENIKLRKLLRKKANKIRAWNKLYKYHNELENDSQHHWEMRELMDTIIKQKLGEEE